MKTLRCVQIAVVAVSLITAVRLADTIQPTSNELIGSVTLAISGIVMGLGLIAPDKKTDEQG